MNKFVCRLFYICLFSIASIYPPFAFAKMIEVKVLPNRTELIYRFVQLNEGNCSAMAVPKMKVISVGHGKIKSKNGGFRIDSGPCKGIKMKGIDIYYTPNPGFKGMDNAKVNLAMAYYVDDSGYSTTTLTFRIHVTNKAKPRKKAAIKYKPRTVNTKNRICFDCSKAEFTHRSSKKVCLAQNMIQEIAMKRFYCKRI